MRKHGVSLVLGLIISVLSAADVAHADLTLTKDTPDLPLTEGLRVSDISQWGRRPINVDGVVQMMVDGTLGEPKAGDVVKRPEAMGGGERKWEEVRANEKGEFGGEGWVRGGAGSYVLCIVEAEEPRVMVLTGVGHSMVYVNGEPRVGDPYMHGYVRTPVALQKGRNQLLFAHAGRGMFKAKLETPKGDGGIEINTGDLTLPDALTDQPGRYMLGIPLINCRDARQAVTIFADQPDRTESTEAAVADIVPLGIYKAAVPVTLLPSPLTTELKVRVRVFDAAAIPPLSVTTATDTKPLAEEIITLRVRKPHETHKRTFVSAIDGSVQYVAIVPPRLRRAEKGQSGGAEEKPNASGSGGQAAQIQPSPNLQSEIRNPTSPQPGLVLSLHGASVEAIRQAESYDAKPDLVIVCPTNRRPFGFDWEDWGRVDAIEAMDHAKKWYNTDPSRQYLTGHSMGGHGTWQLGVLYPDRFAAIAPSAGWLSFDTYAAARGDADKKPEHPAAEFFRRASASSDTVALMENLRGKGIYIIHGDADDNVPVSEARKARAELEKLDIKYESHEQPGAGHWWDDDQPGAACVDWPPVFEMFGKRSLADSEQSTKHSVRTFRPSLGYPTGDGIAVLQQEHTGKRSSVQVSADPKTHKVTVATENVRWLRLGPSVLPQVDVVELEVNGQSRGKQPRGVRGAMLISTTSEQEVAPSLVIPKAESNAQFGLTHGPLKNAFNNGFVLVHGTGGDLAMDRWARAKARFDADQWWYRGNGRAQVVSDTVINAGDMKLGGMICYGRTRPDAQITRLLSPVLVQAFTTGSISRGVDRALLMVAPPSDATPNHGVFAVIGGDSLRAMRTTDRLPYFLSGVGFPDVTVLDADVWSRGIQGVVGVGFFGSDWSTEKGEFWWREETPGEEHQPSRP